MPFRRSLPRLAVAALLLAVPSCSGSPTAPDASTAESIDGIWAGSITGLTFHGASGAPAPIRLEMQREETGNSARGVSGTLVIDSDAGPIHGSFAGILDHEIALDLETGEAWRCTCQARLEAESPGYLRLDWGEWLCVDAGAGVIEVRKAAESP